MNGAIDATGGFDFSAFMTDFGFELAMIAIVCCVVMAFFAMRLYKIFMSLFGAVGIGFIAHSLIGPGAMLEGVLPTSESINVAAAISLGAATLGFILGVALPKFVLFLGGIGIGAVFTKMLIPMVAPSVVLDPTITLILGVVVGILLGVLLSLLFRPVYILLTSLGCSAIAGLVVINLVMPSANILYGALGGLAFGFIAMIYEFRSSALEV
jgi:hypothetical protein